MIERLYCLIELFAMFYLYHRLYEKKLKFDIVTVVFFSVDVVILELINTNIVPAMFSVLIYVATFIYLKIYFSQSIINTIKKLMLAMFIICVIQFGVSGVIYMLLGNKAAEQTLVLSVNIIVAFMVIIICNLREASTRKQIVKWFSNHKLMAAYLIVFVSFCIIVFKFYGRIRIMNAIAIFGFSSVVLSMVAIFQRERSILEMEKQEIRMQNMYHNAFEDMINEIRRKQHNFDNHLNAISNMYLTASSLEELVQRQEEYRRKLLAENKYNKIMNEKSSPVIIGFLYHKFLQAESKNIQVSPHIVIENAECRLSQFKLVEILGILLDNSVEAVEGVLENRLIKFEMIETHKEVIVDVRNPYPVVNREDIGKYFVEGYSTKGDNRGLGLSYVRKIVPKALGKIKAENIWENNINWFSVKIEIEK